MKTEFSQPRFTGARFGEHTLPVEVARDLAAYEVLVIELAKHLYKSDHPDRERVPKGFISNFHLDIERIDAGSARPLLALVVPGSLALTGGGESYFERARDLIAQCVAAAANPLPAGFPKELLVHFNHLGRSLREGEALELPLPRAGSATLTPERRKQLVLAADVEYEREVDLQGSIVEVDWEKETMRLRLLDGTTTVLSMPAAFRTVAGAHGGRPRHVVLAKGVATFDAWDRLKKVISIESLEIVKNYTLASRLDDLGQLRHVWFEGNGVAPDKDKLGFVAEKLVAGYPDDILLPAVFPTQEGNLLLEWEAAGEPSLDIRLDDLRANFHAFGTDGADVEREFDLNAEAGWQAFFASLGECIRKRPA